MVGIVPRETELCFILKMAYEQGAPSRNIFITFKSNLAKRLIVATGMGLGGSVS